MPNIEKEYPEGRRHAEMTLVRLLKRHRSWHEVREISEALWRVDFIADALKREHDKFHNNAGGNCESKSAPAMPESS